MSEANVRRDPPTLWAWPDRARFGRVVPKSKFYEHASVTTRVREQFIAQVAQIAWEFKLGPTTVGLIGSDAVPEIEVLEIALKQDVDDVADDVLAAINRAIPAPLLIEVTRRPAALPVPVEPTAPPVVEPVEATTRLTAAPMKDRTAMFVSTAWLPAGTERTVLPTALDLAGLHAALLAPLMPHAVRPGESLAASVERTAAIRRLEREVAALERRVRNEKQFNRRAEINRLLRARIADLTALTSNPTAEEPQWRS